MNAPLRDLIESLVGQAIARRGHHGFGMKVLYHNRSRLPEAVERELGARYVVLARVEQDRKGRTQAVLYAWDVRLKNRLRGMKLDPEDSREREKAVSEVHDFLTGKHVPGRALPIALPEMVKQPWFWATVGGVAVATTAGILLASQPQKPLGVRLGNFGSGW